jgi:hypothetical protein
MPSVFALKEQLTLNNSSKFTTMTVYSEKHSIVNYLKELSIVVLGVTIALVLGNMNENRKAGVKKKKAISLMLQELKDHQHTFKVAMAYQDTLLNDYEDSLVHQENYDVTLPKLSLNTSAYTFMIYNDIFNDLHFKKATYIMSYYSDLKDLLDLETNLMKAISNNAVNADDPKSIDLIVFWVSQIYAFEEEQLWMNNHLQTELKKGN